ncbi:Protein of unknown function [Gryllus bimaculatus]|nr:Protein of unknown function [Gryllus bimaculatus]
MPYWCLLGLWTTHFRD